MKKEKSYMELCIHLDGKENVYLRVPTVWDSVEKQWVGFIKTPITHRLISGNGKTSFDLNNSFNINMSKLMAESEEIAKEVFEMFMPAFYWEE
jgi:hypothetical protein